MKFIRFGDHAIDLHEVKMMRICKSFNYGEESFILTAETECGEIPSQNYKTWEEASKALDEYLVALNAPSCFNPWTMPKQEPDITKLSVQFESEE